MWDAEDAVPYMIIILLSEHLSLKKCFQCFEIFNIQSCRFFKCLLNKSCESASGTEFNETVCACFVHSCKFGCKAYRRYDVLSKE